MQFLKDKILKYKTLILISLIVIISIISIVVQNLGEKTKITINNTEINDKENEEKIAVYIAGEVKKPGVYYIEENLRLNDLIEKCGGLTEEADLSDINLAEKLNDSDKIEIPKRQEEIEEFEEENEFNNGLVNINKATKEELKSLNGVGDTLANNIIEYRKNNKFDTIEDIMNVNGIGESKYNSIKEYICVN